MTAAPNVVSGVATSDSSPIDCPYAGLDPYTIKLRDYFFGRRRESQLIAANLIASPLTILYGSSGVGKSSVLQAGVIPDLAKSKRVVVTIARAWRGDGFASAIKADVLSELQQRDINVGEINSSLPLDEFLEACHAEFDGLFLFIFDQFEQYFLYDAAQRSESFDLEFARAVNRSDVRAHFLVSMREDELARLDRLHKRIPNLFTNRFSLQSLTRDAAKEAIVRPIALFAEREPQRKVPKSLEDTLVKALLDSQVVFSTSGVGRVDDLRPAAEGEVAERLIEMPFLQLVLTRLWKLEVEAGADSLRFKTYDDLGGADGIVRSFVADTLRKQPPRRRKIAAKAFQYLVTPSGTKIAYSCADLAAQIEMPDEEVTELIHALSGESRLLRSVVSRSADGKQIERYEIAHDRLAPAILDWCGAYKFDQRAERRLRWVGAGAIVFVALVLAVVWGQRQTNSGFRVRALADRSMHLVNEDPVAAAVLAVEAFQTARGLISIVS